MLAYTSTSPKPVVPDAVIGVDYGHTTSWLVTIGRGWNPVRLAVFAEDAGDVVDVIMDAPQWNYLLAVDHEDLDIGEVTLCVAAGSSDQLADITMIKDCEVCTLYRLAEAR